MIGLDTNVLIRAFMVDDSEQTRRARRLIARECSGESPGLINNIVLAETVWVLETVYGYRRDAIAAVVARLLTVNDVAFEHREIVRAALDIFLERPVGFADALIGAINRAEGCSATATFDRRAATLEGFTTVR